MRMLRNIAIKVAVLQVTLICLNETKERGSQD